MSRNDVLIARRAGAIETVHGMSVADPYRWLEDADNPETHEWTAAQNARTEALLTAIPGRATLEARLHALFSVGIVSQPAVRGRRLFYLKREGEQAQPVLYVRDGIDGPERVVLDPTASDPSGLTALDWWFPSADGQLVAYGTSEGGDEWSTLRIVEVHSGRVLQDVIPRTRYSSVAWQANGRGFFYTRYPDPGAVPPSEEEYHSHAFHHRLGDDPARDPKVFGEGRSPQDMIGLRASSDGRWLVATAFEGWTRSDVYLCDLSVPDPVFQPIVEGIDASFGNALPTTTRIYLLTNWHAANYRIVAVDPLDPSPERWVTVIPERADRVIAGFTLVDGRIVTHELERATSRLRVYQLDGTPSHELPLPALGTVDALDGEEDGSWVVVGFESFAIPPASFVFDLESRSRLPLAPMPLPAGFDPHSIEVNQVSYPSRDGTPITMFLIDRGGLARNGDNPVILTGYGGFNISMGPCYSPTYRAWIERGGIVAVPNLRGGGEYGEAWHQAGMLGNKQNVFDDFIAAADWLVGQEYTRPERLAIVGGSNGGLLVGAALTQRPELFQAVVCAVPLLDMVRYHHFRIAKLWIPEYGSADDPEAFRWLIAYSPYHRVVAGTCYPATLLSIGEEDSRVDPMHARKMAALLQWASSCAAEKPILLRAETEAGHGAGKPLAKQVAEASDALGFISWQLDVTWEPEESLTVK